MDLPMYEPLYGYQKRGWRACPFFVPSSIPSLYCRPEHEKGEMG